MSVCDAPRMLSGLSDVAESYDALVCDVWGVLHDGRRPFPGAADALRRMRASGRKVLLASNAPRPARAVAAMLDGMGVGRDVYDVILTSGDLVRRFLSAFAKEERTCHHVGLASDLPLVVEDTGVRTVGAADADAVLLTGFRDPSLETPADYEDDMRAWAARNMLLICANPDREVRVGPHLVRCAGILADFYERIGGPVLRMGKPSRIVYDTAAEMLADGPNGGGDLLAIGDGPLTDVAGARNAGHDVVFICGGLSETADRPLDTPERIAAFLASEGTAATYAMRRLSW